MHVIHVQVHVTPDTVDAFKEATLTNARASLKESGIARFDVVQQRDDSTRFVLVEVYRTPEDQGRHRQTAHYAAWAEAVAPMMAEPRSSRTFDSLFPDGTEW